MVILLLQIPIIGVEVVAVPLELEIKKTQERLILEESPVVFSMMEQICFSNTTTMELSQSYLQDAKYILKNLIKNRFLSWMHNGKLLVWNEAF